MGIKKQRPNLASLLVATPHIKTTTTLPPNVRLPIARKWPLAGFSLVGEIVGFIMLEKRYRPWAL